jgi:hypothetical protein
VVGIEASAQTSQGRLSLVYTLAGQLEFLRFPPPGPARRAERLWEHTCFEAFIAAPNSPAYCELNLAPSGEWAVYAFRQYREGMALWTEPTPAISARRSPGCFELTAAVDLAALPGPPEYAQFRLGLSAVIEDQEGKRSYWALRHSPGRPDFHHPDAFALTLAAVDHPAAWGVQ